MNEPTFVGESDTLFLVSGIPGFKFAWLATVEDLLASGTGHQLHASAAPTLVAVLEQRLPATRQPHITKFRHSSAESDARVD